MISLTARMTIHCTCRRTDRVLEFFDLSVFCFRAPYNFKHEANLLRVEVGIKGRKIRKIENMIRRTSKRKRGKTSNLSSEEDTEEEDEEEAEAMVDGDGEEMDEVLVKEDLVFLDEAHVGLEVDLEPDHSANNYLVGRSIEDDPPYRPHESVDDDSVDDDTVDDITVIVDDD